MLQGMEGDVHTGKISYPVYMINQAATNPLSGCLGQLKILFGQSEVQSALPEWAIKI